MFTQGWHVIAFASALVMHSQMQLRAILVWTHSTECLQKKVDSNCWCLTPTPGNTNNTCTIQLWLKIQCMRTHSLTIDYINHIIHSRNHQIISNFYAEGLLASAKMDSQFLHNLIFLLFTEVTSAHPSIKYFRRDLLPYMYENSPQKIHIFKIIICETIQNCQLFLRHSVHYTLYH